MASSRDPAESNEPARRRIGIIFDERFLEHKTGHAHPEQPRRLAGIYRMIEREFMDRTIILRPEPATVEQVEMVHTPGHVRRILKTAEQRISSMAPDTQVSARTYMAAWLASGACVQGIDMLMEDKADAFFALVRPPGHHALAGKAGGFCIFNNIAIAARWAMHAHGKDRILVIDWDVHHGNGIHALFYSDPHLYYYSTHDTELYPYSGFLTDTGEGPGLGYTMNLPLSREMKDNDMVRLYEMTLLPVLAGYNPELIMVAAGFDAHAEDPVGKCGFTENLYGRLTRMIMDYYLCSRKPSPPLFFALEGGYDPPAVVRSVRNVLATLCGEERFAHAPETPAMKSPGAASATADTIARQAMEIHRKYGIVAADCRYGKMPITGSAENGSPR